MSCARCSWDIPLAPDGRAPAWCPHCGVDFREATGENQKEKIVALASPALERAPVASLRRFPGSPRPAPSSEAFAPAESPLSVTPAWSPPQPEPSPSDDSEPPADSPEIAPPGFVPPAPATGWGQFDLGALAVAAIALLTCLALANHSVDKLTTHQKAQGKVVRLVVGHKGRTYPEIAYWVAGKSYLVQGGSSGGFWQVGDPVEMLVPPRQPDQATINCFSNMWLGPLIAGVLGAGCLFVGLAGRRHR